MDGGIACGLVENAAAAGRVERNREAAIVRACALVAQLDRASDFESEGREFESLRARQIATTVQAFVMVAATRHMQRAILSLHSVREIASDGDLCAVGAC
jgi:hypothetical protein